MGDTGTEQLGKMLGNMVNDDEGGTYSGTRRAQTPQIPADLVELVIAWAELPEALKLGILAMVRASGKGNP